MAAESKTVSADACTWILILRRRYRPRAVVVFELELASNSFINNYGIGADEMTVA
jgi:hypothetical protein